MADTSATVHIGENSPEQVAYRLMQDIAAVEGREFFAHGSKPVDREWLLRTFYQCRRAVTGSGPIDDVVKAFKQ